MIVLLLCNNHSLIMRQALTGWLKETNAGEASRPEESVESVEAVEAEGSNADSSTVSGPVVRTRADALHAKAVELIKTFITVLTDNTDLTTLKNAVMSASTLRQSENGSNRLSIIDPGLDAEPSAAFTKSHDVYGRQPGLLIKVNQNSSHHKVACAELCMSCLSAETLQIPSNKNSRR